MDRNKLWMIGAAAVVVAIVIGGWIVGIQPQINSVDAANTQKSSVDQQNIQDEATLTQLKSDFANIGKLKADLAALTQSVPAQEDITSFTSEIAAVAAMNQVSVTSVTWSDAKPYAPPAAPAVASTPAPTSAATPSPTATAGATSPSAPVSGPPAATPPTTVANPAITAANFVAVPVSIEVTGPVQNWLTFVSGMQHGTRLFLVDSLVSAPLAVASTTTSKSAAPAPSGQVDATISGLIFVLLTSDNPTGVPTPKSDSSGSGAPSPSLSPVVPSSGSAATTTSEKSGS